MSHFCWALGGGFVTAPKALSLPLDAGDGTVPLARDRRAPDTSGLSSGLPALAPDRGANRERPCPSQQAAQNATDERGERLIWLPRAVLDRPNRLHGPAESYSDVS